MESVTPIMNPAPGSRLLRYVGDVLRFELTTSNRLGAPKGWRAMLRTNLGRASTLRKEILDAHTRGLPLAGGSWRDVPMSFNGETWSVEFPLSETGFFKAKGYLLDERGWQHWPTGPDLGISIHPDRYRTGNILYCAFPRMFGTGKSLASTQDPELESNLKRLDDSNYAVIPPSGKLRDVQEQLPHIFQRLGCKVLHLLPINPTPTTYARFGRFGSPYAALDLRAVDPALVVFDKRTTGVDQFRELAYSVHQMGGRVFLDMVINHTGWGSVLQENHPEWYLRKPDNTFVSPGAWGVIWEDLVELKHRNVELWDELADTFLTWCRRGVDGFRCDAGYMVPVPAWQYIIARVQQEYPETIFFLEGLGGAWEATETLLTEGGMQWAYSELFQNYSGAEVAAYSNHSFAQSERVGLLLHYSETHDNQRLAGKGRTWSLLRNRLLGLLSTSGGFGFTCGVEWLATEKIRVHGSTGMNWGAEENIVTDLAKLNRLLAEHPCFFDGAVVKRLTPGKTSVQSWLRVSAEGSDRVLVIANTSTDFSEELVIDSELVSGTDISGLLKGMDLLGQLWPPPKSYGSTAGRVQIPPGAVYCLSQFQKPLGLSGDFYKNTRAKAAWALQIISSRLADEHIGFFDWKKLSALVDKSPADFLARVSRLPAQPHTDIIKALEQIDAHELFPNVIRWTAEHERRVTAVPPDHWLLVASPSAFRAALQVSGEPFVVNKESLMISGEQIAVFPPRASAAEATLLVESYGAGKPGLNAALIFLGRTAPKPNTSFKPTDLVLLTNGRGGMARICLDLGRVNSKYDCVLGANLHAGLPVDRHIFAKRIRVWVNADGFLSPLDFRQLVSFHNGPPATWQFVANAGDGRSVQIQISAEMLQGENTVLFRFARPSLSQASGKQLPAAADVRLTVRLDLEDRGFHSETKRNSGAEYHFCSHTRTLETLGEQKPDSRSLVGFAFTPAKDRHLQVYADGGQYYPQAEWSENIPHPVEQSRGQVGAGDAWSPGWFDLPMKPGECTTLVVTAESNCRVPDGRDSSFQVSSRRDAAESDWFERQLSRAIFDFVVRRGNGKTVVAGYPWFLDWGRDTFICARGLISAGLIPEVRAIVEVFAGFEHKGTLPNTIFGSDASNRDTSDAPLWFIVVCEELADHYFRASGEEARRAFFDQKLEQSDRTILQVIESILRHYMEGTPNGVKMDSDSGLIWSPSHFTWMDTNYPAGTPREGYPVEIQALWIRALRFVSTWSNGSQKEYLTALADRALGSVQTLFWLPEQGYYSDLLIAPRGLPAKESLADDALRSNSLFLVSLGLVTGQRAQRCVQMAREYLVIPGALRSLAPLPTKVPLPIRSHQGQLLNDPHAPYWGHYEGDEDTKRKAAYHNGTAWTWTFPVFCEALARAWGWSSQARATSLAYLGSMGALMNSGCIGHVPEVMDGDAPHTQRGCDAQAWGATEALRVLKLLQQP